MNLRIFPSFIFAILFTYGLRAEFRTWTSTTGTSIEAKLVNNTDNEIRLQTRDRHILKIGRPQLSNKDIHFLEIQSKKRPSSLTVTKVINGKPDWVRSEREIAAFYNLPEWLRATILPDLPNYEDPSSFKSWDTTTGEKISEAKLYQKWPNHIILENKLGERRSVEKSLLTKDSLSQISASYLPEMIEAKDDEIEIAFLDSNELEPTEVIQKSHDTKNKICATSASERLVRKDGITYAKWYFWTGVVSERKIVGINYYGPPEVWKHEDAKKYGRYNSKVKYTPRGYATWINFSSLSNYESEKYEHLPMVGQKPFILPNEYHFTVIVKK